MLIVAMETHPEKELPQPFRGHQEKRNTELNPPARKAVVDVERDADTTCEGVCPAEVWNSMGWQQQAEQRTPCCYLP